MRLFRNPNIEQVLTPKSLQSMTNHTEHCRGEGHQALFDSSTVVAQVGDYWEKVTFESFEILPDHTAMM